MFSTASYWGKGGVIHEFFTGGRKFGRDFNIYSDQFISCTVPLEKFGDKLQNTPNMPHFKDAPAVEYLIALLFSKILKIRYYLEFNILRW